MLHSTKADKNGFKHAKILTEYFQIMTVYGQILYLERSNWVTKGTHGR